MNSKRKLLATSFMIFLLLILASAVQAVEVIDVNVNLQVVSCVTNSNKKDCNTTLIASLVRADNGTPLSLANETIAFYQDGIGRTTIRTKSNGQATKVLKTKKGSHYAQAEFVSHKNYLAHSPSGVVAYICTVPDPPIVVKLNGCITYVWQYDDYDCQATASGGNGGPYSFYKETMGSFPPMMVLIAPNGQISGKVTSPPGSYPFSVCASDTGGNYSKKCANFGIKVKPCPKNTHADPLLKKCVRDKEEPTCPEGQHYDADLKACVDDEDELPIFDVPLGTYNLRLTAKIVTPYGTDYFDSGDFEVINDSEEFLEEQYNQLKEAMEEVQQIYSQGWTITFFPLSAIPWNGTSFALTGSWFMIENGPPPRAQGTASFIFLYTKK